MSEQVGRSISRKEALGLSAAILTRAEQERVVADEPWLLMPIEDAPYKESEQLVYIVLDASWGDRSIEGVYTTPEAADTAAAKCRRWAAGDEYVVVEPWPVKDEGDE